MGYMFRSLIIFWKNANIPFEHKMINKQIFPLKSSNVTLMATFPVLKRVVLRVVGGYTPHWGSELPGTN